MARLNKACERIKVFEDDLDISVLFQTLATRIMNEDLIKISKESNYRNPYEFLTNDLKIFANEEIFRCEAVELMVKLKLYPEIIWRRVIAPTDITFNQLHKIIQIAFDWKNYHLYQFNIFDESGNCVLNIISESEEDYESMDECQILLDLQVNLSDYINQKYRIVYCYDFGDNWEHEITIQDINTEYNKNYPICLMGEGNAPPEDVGGVSGYKEFLKIMVDPNQAEYENMRNWAQGQRYKDFDLVSVNRQLKYSLRR